MADKENVQVGQSAPKKNNRWFFRAFVLVWTVLVLWNFLTPSQKRSETENRELAQLPKYSLQALLDGDYMAGMDTYFNDQFAGRSYWVGAQTMMEYGLGKRVVNDVYLGKNALFDKLSPVAGASAGNVKGVNAFASEYAIPTYVMLVPSGASIQKDKLPLFATPWDEVAYISQTNASFAENVMPLDVAPVLLQHEGAYIYYRTDHHWTSYGAYLGYTVLAEGMGLPAYEQQDFTIEKLSNSFKGSLHSKTVTPLVSADSMELYQRGEGISMEVFDGKETVQHDGIYYDEYLESKNKYSYYLGQMQPYISIKTAADTGKKLIMFKDSYAHCLTPMLLDEYSEITMVDLRLPIMKDLEQFFDMSTYDDALFLYSANVFANQDGPTYLAQ